MPKQGVPKIRSHSKSIFQFILFSVKTSPNVFVCGLALRVRMSPSPLIHTRCTCAVINRVLQHYVAWNSSRKTLVNETCFFFSLFFSPPLPSTPRSFPETRPPGLVSERKGKMAAEQSTTARAADNVTSGKQSRRDELLFRTQSRSAAGLQQRSDDLSGDRHPRVPRFLPGALLI